MLMTRRQLLVVKKGCIVLPFYLFTFLPLSAQTFTQRVQTNVQGEGVVTIHHDKAIDDLVNGSAARQTTPAKTNPNTGKKNADKQKTTPAAETSKPTPTKPAQPVQHQNDTVVQRQLPDTLDTTPRRTYKTTGYRVQAFAGGNTRRDRQRAEQIGNSLRQLFPGEDVYVHFYAPRWICRLGNYRTYDEAHERMLEIRKLGYESATVVKGKITLTQ